MPMPTQNEMIFLFVKVCSFVKGSFDVKRSHGSAGNISDLAFYELIGYIPSFWSECCTI